MALYILQTNDSCSQIDGGLLLGEELDLFHVAPKSRAS